VAFTPLVNEPKYFITDDPNNEATNTSCNLNSSSLCMGVLNLSVTRKGTFLASSVCIHDGYSAIVKVQASVT
jgi:hypothetical protein